MNDMFLVCLEICIFIFVLTNRFTSFRNTSHTGFADRRCTAAGIAYQNRKRYDLVSTVGISDIQISRRTTDRLVHVL